MKAILVLGVFLLMSFSALAQVPAGSYSFAGFACHLGGNNFKTAPVPEQAPIDGVWEIRANGSMKVTATQEECEMTIEGSYSADDSMITYTVSDSSVEGHASCPSPPENESQSHKYVVSGNFLYIAQPRELDGREAACGNNDIYIAFLRQ